MSFFSYSQIYLNKSYKEFAGIQKSAKDALLVIVGMPYDSTTTFRPGTRFAPSSIRDASINLETNSLLTEVFLEDIDFYDAGDVDLIGLDVREALRRINTLAEEVNRAKKILVSIGGEHTITYGITRGMDFDTLLIFDAHLDLRDEYPTGMRYAHATVTRRIYEDLRPPKIAIIGARAFSKDELNFAKIKDIEIISSNTINEDLKGSINYVRDLLKNSKKIYVSIDMDVFDPAYCPAVSNPEPFGIDVKTFFEFAKNVFNEKVVGFDVVEVSPNYDSGISSILAARVIFEAMALIWSSLP